MARTKIQSSQHKGKERTIANKHEAQKFINSPNQNLNIHQTYNIGSRQGHQQSRTWESPPNADFKAYNQRDCGQGKDVYSYSENTSNMQGPANKSTHAQVYRAASVKTHPDVAFESGAWLFDHSDAPQWLLFQLPPPLARGNQHLSQNQSKSAVAHSHVSYQQKHQQRMRNAQVYKPVTLRADPDVGFESGAWLFDSSAAPQWLSAQLPATANRIHNQHRMGGIEMSQTASRKVIKPSSSRIVANQPMHKQSNPYAPHAMQCQSHQDRSVPKEGKRNNPVMYDMWADKRFILDAFGPESAPSFIVLSPNQDNTAFHSRIHAFCKQSNGKTEPDTNVKPITNIKPNANVNSNAITQSTANNLSNTNSNTNTKQKNKLQYTPSKSINCATDYETNEDVGFESGSWLFDLTSAPIWLLSQLPKTGKRTVPVGNHFNGNNCSLINHSDDRKSSGGAGRQNMRPSQSMKTNTCRPMTTNAPCEISNYTKHPKKRTHTQPSGQSRVLDPDTMAGIKFDQEWVEAMDWPYV